MSRIVKVSESDYVLKVRSGGTITFDTRDSFGSPTGNIIIQGNLDVKGTTSTVESTITTIKDNIIQVNYGQTGDGISSVLGYQAGFQFGRGTRSDAMLVFKDNVSHYDPTTSTQSQGTFVFKTFDGELQGIQTDCVVTDGSTDLIFDLTGSDHVLRIQNGDITPLDYSNKLLTTLAQPSNDNIIPNRKFVTDYITSGLVIPGQADVDRIYYASPPGPAGEKARVQAWSSYIDFAIDKIQIAQITSTGLDVKNINLFNNTIRNTTSNNLILTSSNNTVEINSILKIVDREISSLPPASDGISTRLYSKSNMGTAATGKSGIFFSNDIAQDELVAKNRALLFSMLF